MKWSDIYNSLKTFFYENGQQGEPPPIPLILGGWNFSNDHDKKDRWLKTVNWAKANKCDMLIPILREDEMYVVKELSSYIPFQYLNWNEEPRTRPTEKEIEEYLLKLNKNWKGILGSEFGHATRPVKFSGSKLRRLIVSYRNGYLPPWGSWTNHLAFGSPSKFTELRKSVNKIIQPHEVDHIDFISESTR